MRIAKNDSFGAPEVVRLVEVPVPSTQKDQILVQVLACSVSVADSRLRSRNVPRGFGFIMGLLFGFKRPRYSALGTDMAGRVVQVGSAVKKFKVGDRVVADLGMALGGHAEYRVLAEGGVIAKIPDGVSVEDAAALVFGGMTALLYLRDRLKVQSGESVLVIGAGGAVGSAAVQLAIAMGANVTAVCSTGKAMALKSHGIDRGVARWIDYQTQNWLEEPTQYSAIVDAVGGCKRSALERKLVRGGRAALIVADLLENIGAAISSLVSNKKFYAGSLSGKARDLEQLLSLCVSGKFKPLIGARFPLEQIVDAHRLVDGGHKLGTALITFNQVKE